MRCAEVHQAIREGRAWDPQVIAHAQGCGPCAVLLDAGGELGVALSTLPPEALAPPALPPRRALPDRGIRGWLRRRSSPTRGVLAWAVVFAVVLGILWIKPRPDLGSYPVVRMAGILGMFGVLIAGGLAIRLRPLHRPPPTAGFRAITVLAALLVPLLIAGCAEAITGHMASVPKGPFWTTARTCFVFGTSTGGALYLALWALERRTRPPVWGVVLSAGLLGVLGNLSLQLFCPVTAPSHLLVGHASVGFVWAALFGIVALLRRC